MIAVDTNIIVRLLTHDDEQQFRLAHAVFEMEAIFIPDTVLLETEWVLRFAYEFEAAEIQSAFIKLLGLPNIRVANPDLLAKAIEWHGTGLDFADALHLTASQDASRFLTFDSKFIKNAQGLSRCRVERP